MPISGARSGALNRSAAGMTIQDLGAIGELVGAVATVATLAYLAVQIRANTQMMRAQSRREHQSSNAQYAIALAQNSDLADIFNRGLAGFESLTDAERTQFIFLFSQIVGVVEAAYGDWKNGVTDRAELDRTMAGSGALLASPGGRSYWRAFSARGGYSEGFRSFMDSKLSDRSGPDPGSREDAAEPGAAGVERQES